MTKKRFTFDEDANEDRMYEMGVFSDNGEVMETTDVLNCLNELHEENQALKSSNLEYEDALARLEEQNEELKKENKRLDDLWGEKCVREHMKFLGETALKEMHDERYGDLE